MKWRPGAVEENRDDVAKELQKHIKDIVGVSTQIVVHFEGGVARSEGKAKRVIDKRNQ